MKGVSDSLCTEAMFSLVAVWSASGIPVQVYNPSFGWALVCATCALSGCANRTLPAHNVMCVCVCALFPDQGHPRPDPKAQVRRKAVGEDRRSDIPRFRFYVNAARRVPMSQDPIAGRKYGTVDAWQRISFH